jgi:ABC-type dipeptide/oligopeptide/nickel transport system permease component
MHHGVLRYALRRFSQVVPLVFAVIICNFLLTHLAPGDPVDLFLRDGASEEVVHTIRSAYGLDKPLYLQLVNYIASVMKGNLGVSFRYNRPVLDLVIEHIPRTLLLMSTSLVIASLFGILLGVLSALKPFTLSDNLIAVVSLAGYSLPIFWFGQILVMVFALHFDLFPTGGMLSVRENYSGMARVLDIAWHLVLPAICFASYNLALICRVMRASMLEVLRKEYVTTARSKGLPERVVVLRHMLRNAMIPVVTVIGMSLGLMFAGSVLTETVFSWPGLGRLTYDSIVARDYPVLMGIFIVISAGIIVANFLTDLIYCFLDPRIRYE